MKKITSFLSLALILSVTLLLSSCNECEGGAGSGISGDVQQQLDDLAAQLGVEGQKIAALSSDGVYVITVDENGDFWLSNPNGTSTPINLKSVALKGDKGEDGKDGVDGKDGKDGVDGKDGKDGVDGKDGKDGVDGKDGKDGVDGKDGKSGILDNVTKGIYVNYMDGDTEKQIYIPEFNDNGDGTITIKVGGTNYVLPSKGCKCKITKNDDGTYTITDGTTEAKIPVVAPWVDKVTVEYQTDHFVIYETANPTNKIDLTKSKADLSIDDKGVATVTSADGTKSIQLQKTQPVAEAVGKDSVVIINYNLAGEEIEKYYMPSAGAFADMTKTVNGIKTDVDKLKAQVGEWDETKGTIAESIAGIDKRITDLQSEVNSLFEKMLQALASMITNIQIEEVMSNAIGSYNGVLTNLKTTKLIGYWGTFQDNVKFPSDIDFGADPKKPDPIKAGIVFSDTLGTIQLTVNPIGTDFSANGGVAVSLVNSIGEESKIKLSNLVSSDKKLVTGRTRAVGTGLYETTATIAIDDVNDSRLKMAIDYSAVKNAIKDTYHNLQDVYKQRSLGAFKGETLNEIANAIHTVVEGISTERLAVKTSYTYETKDLNGNSVFSTKSIVSPYDISAVTVAPLGFESLPEQYRDSLRVFKKAKGLIKRLNTKIANKVISTIENYTNLSTIESQIADLQGKLAKIQPIENTLTTDISMHLYIKTEADLDFDQTMVVGYEIIVPTVLYNTPGWEDDIKGQGAWINKDKTKTLASDPAYTLVYIEQNVQFHVKKTVPVEIDDDVTAKNVTIDVSDLVEPVNNAVDAIKSINALCESVNSIISNIYKVEDKLLAGNYLDRVYKFIDKASYYSAKGLYKLFLPVLLVNSDSGFGFAGIRGVPATVSGTVEVIPTTYSNGLVAPIYRKCIIVNGKAVPGSNGKYVHNDPVLDITSYLNSGENVIEYYALDYHGNEAHEEYVIIKK